MKFRLVYRGPLKSGNSKSKEHIHEVRAEIHKQLALLWKQPPLAHYGSWLERGNWERLPDDNSHPIQSGHRLIGVMHTIREEHFSALVSPLTEMLAELDILVLRPAPPGAVLRDGGDLDNRIKTLIDALRLPSWNELPSKWAADLSQRPFHCLLSDDKLVSAFKVTSDRLLEADANENEVLVVIEVTLTASRVTMDNIGLVSR